MLCAVAWCGLVAPGAAQDAQPSIVYREQVTAFFSEAKAKFTFEIAAPKKVASTAAWMLTANGRVPLQLKVSFRVGEEKKPAAELTLDLWLFHDNPFVDREKSLETLTIQLFDPPGDTAAALEKLKIPFKPVANVDALPDVVQGVVLIGEGVSLNDYRSLPKCFATLAD